MAALTTAPTVHARPQGRSDLGRIVGGLVLLLPTLVLWLVALLLPTVQTLALSRQNVRLAGEATAVGFANYRQLFASSGFAAAREFTALLVFERLLVVAVVPLALALALHAFGRVARIPLRILFTIPFALFAPVSVALIWMLAYNPQYGLFGGGQQSPLASAAGARGAFLRMDALTTFGLACGVGLIVYLAALRGGRRVGPVLIVWLVTLLGTTALALQSFTPSFVLTGGGPANRTTTLALLEYTASFRDARLGTGAAVATTIALFPAVCGIITAILIAASGLRLTLVPARQSHAPLGGSARAVAALGLGIVGLCSVAAIVYSNLPVLWAGLTSLKSRAEAIGAGRSLFPSAATFEAYARLERALPGGQLLANTVVPVAIGVLLIQLPIAYLGALGIGALRPLGRHSEWLLLPFSPWLFIGALPLGIANYQRLQEAGLLNTFISLIPPSTLAVPMLFILTLRFKGGTVAWQAARAAGAPAVGSFLRLVIAPSLPLALLLALGGLVIGMQDLFWPLLVANSPEQRTIPLALVELNQRATADLPLITAAIWRFGLPGFVLLILVLVPLQAFYLDRLALVTERSAAQGAASVQG